MKRLVLAATPILTLGILVSLLGAQQAKNTFGKAAAQSDAARSNTLQEQFDLLKKQNDFLIKDREAAKKRYEKAIEDLKSKHKLALESLEKTSTQKITDLIEQYNATISKLKEDNERTIAELKNQIGGITWLNVILGAEEAITCFSDGRIVRTGKNGVIWNRKSAVGPRFGVYLCTTPLENLVNPEAGRAIRLCTPNYFSNRFRAGRDERKSEGYILNTGDRVGPIYITWPSELSEYFLE
jgi:hypothetical protein